MLVRDGAWPQASLTCWLMALLTISILESHIDTVHLQYVYTYSTCLCLFLQKKMFWVNLKCCWKRISVLCVCVVSEIQKTHQHRSEDGHCQRILTLPKKNKWWLVRLETKSNIKQHFVVYVLTVSCVCVCLCVCGLSVQTWLFQQLAPGSGHRQRCYWSSQAGRQGRAGHLLDHLST